MMTKTQLERLERIAAQILAGLTANPDDVGLNLSREESAMFAIAQAQELITQLDALAIAE